MTPGQQLMILCAGFGFFTGFLALMVAAHPKETAAGCAVGLITAAVFAMAAMQANVYFGIA